MFHRWPDPRCLLRLMVAVFCGLFPAVISAAAITVVGDTRPVYLTAVGEAGDRILRAEVVMVDADSVEVPEAWGDFDLVDWLAERGEVAGHTDWDGIAMIEEAPRDAWALVRKGDRSAIVRIRSRSHRNRRVTLQVDRPLRIRTVDAEGRPVPDVSIDLSYHGGGATCGYIGACWTGRPDADGEVRLENPALYRRTYVFAKPADSGGMYLSAETRDGVFHSRDLDPGECVSGGAIEFVLEDEPEPVLPEQESVPVERRCLRLLVRDDAGETLGDDRVWFEVFGVPERPLSRDCIVGRCDGGIVEVRVYGDYPDNARLLLSAETSTGQTGRVVLNPSTLPDDEHVDVTLKTVEPTIFGVVKDRRAGALSGKARVTLYASLPVRDHPADRAAAVRAMRDPDYPDRILWPFQSRFSQRGARFEFAEPWSLFGGPDPRWFVVAEVEGWWRSDPIRLPDDRSPIEIPIGMWHK